MFPAITYRLAHHSLVEFQWNVPRILSTAEKYARDVKDKDIFRGNSCDKYLKNIRTYLTAKKEFLEIKKKKKERTESIRFLLRATIALHEIPKKNSHFTFIRLACVE